MLVQRDDLLTAVEYLIKCESKKLDFILVETNGLADPSAVNIFIFKTQLL